MLRKCCVVIAILILSVGFSSSSNSRSQPVNHYVTAQEISLMHILPPPPAPGSEAYKRDIAAVLHAQSTRTSEDVMEAQLDARISVFRFETALGKDFNPKTLPMNKALFKRVKHVIGYDIYKVKTHYARLRPYRANKMVQPIVSLPNNDSYPSGHSAFAYTCAILLAKMVPEKASQIYARADEFANNRIVAGVHYPSDIAAGKLAARLITKQLFHDKEFITDFSKAKQELRSTLHETTREAQASLNDGHRI